MKPICITFAGPAGCSKSPVAHYLSCEFGLPVLTNDVVRSEVREDYPSGEFNQEEYTRRVIARIKKFAADNKTFIYDASNDRHWLKFLDNFESPDSYEFAVISFDLSEKFYKKLLKAKGYTDIYELADRYLADHKKFLKEHSDVVACTITDESFPQRLETAREAVYQFVADKYHKIS